MRVLIKCKDCGKEISHTAGTCPSCGCKKPFSKALIAAKDIKEWDREEAKSFTKSGGTINAGIKPLRWILAMSFIGIVVMGVNEESKLTPEQKAARHKERVIAKERDEKEKKENEISMMSAEFYSLGQCLEIIRKSSESELDIVTDKPDEVSGFLSNGQGFGCQKKTTGTKGTYFEGWYFKKGE